MTRFDTTAVTVSVDGGVAAITLNAPRRANAIGTVLARDLAAAAHRCEHDDVRAVLLCGAGRSFCAGGDLREFGELAPDDIAGRLREVTAALHDAVRTLTSLAVPVVAAAQGNVAGAGVSLLRAAGLVVAAENATFTLAYTAIGYTPDGGASWLLPRLIGQRRTLELLLLNRRLSATEALDWGLVTTATPDDLARQAEALAVRLAAGPRAALGAVKRFVRQGWGTDLPGALDAERAAIVASASSADGREGSAAFLARRPPVFDAAPPSPAARGG